MKRLILRIGVSLFMLLYFTGCSDSSTKNSETKTSKQEIIKNEVAKKPSVPEFDGIYVQLKNNDFIELDKSKNTGFWKERYGYNNRSYNTYKAAIVEDINDFIINKVELSAFKLLFIKGQRGNISGLYKAENKGEVKGYYWMTRAEKYGDDIPLRIANDKYSSKGQPRETLSRGKYLLETTEGEVFLIEFN